MENKIISKRVAVIDKKHCVACGTCIKVCPRSAVKVWRGCHAAVAESDCVGCGKCAKVCPASCIEIREREVQ